MHATPGTHDAGLGGEVRPISAPPAATSLDDLSNSDSGFYDGAREQGDEGGIRQRTLAEAARGVGIRGGYADEARRINDALERQFAGRLGSSLRVRHVDVLRGGTVRAARRYHHDVGRGDIRRHIPLHLRRGLRDRQGRQGRHQDADLARVSHPARDRADAPQRSLSPKNQRREAICGALPSRKGGQRGIQEAREEFIASLDRLIRDYDGMVRYRDLQSQGDPVRPHGHLNRRTGYRATADGRRAFVDETAIRITVMPKFKGSVPRGAGRP